MRALTKTEINSICAQNKVIRNAYGEFRKAHPYSKVTEMWEQAHFVLPIEEAYIRYIVGGEERLFEYRG